MLGYYCVICAFPSGGIGLFVDGLYKKPSYVKYFITCLVIYFAFIGILFVIEQFGGVLCN